MQYSAIHSEQDKLDHQRSRIEEILESRSVSAEMESHLRGRLTDINRRLVMLQVSVQVSRPALPVPPAFMAQAGAPAASHASA